MNIFKKKEPNYCIECKYFVPAGHIDEFDRCNFAKCAFNLPNEVERIRRVCPEQAGKGITKFRDMLDYCTYVRKRTGVHCKNFKEAGS
jgi:hypothetical protein